MQEKKERKEPEIKTRFGILIDADYIITNNETKVRLLMKGKRVYYLYDIYEPYFYLDAKAEEIPKLMKASALHRGARITAKRIEEVEKEVEGHRRKVLKVFAHHPPEVPDLRAAFKDLHAWEYNIPFGRRYMIDKQLTPLSKLKYERKGKMIVKIMAKKECVPKFRMMSFDIETYNPLGAPRPEKDPAIMITYATSEKMEDAKLITYKEIKGAHFSKNCGDEKGMINEFCGEIKKFDPDIITGYNSTNFDLPYLEARAKKTGAKLALGRDGSSFSVRKAGIREIAKIRGRVYIDLFPLLRFLAFIGAVKLNRFSLDFAYEGITGKKEAWKENMQKLEIWQSWDDEKKLPHLAEYARFDAHATWEIAKLVLPLELEMAKITNMSPTDVMGATSSQLVESLLMYEASARGAIVPNRPNEAEVKARTENPIQGAFVKTPPPGIYENIVVFDFRGLYPSIIISHNIDPFSLNLKDAKEGSYFVSPTGAKFSKEPRGLIPQVLEKVITTRGKLKDELKKLKPDTDEYRAVFARQQSLKILANSYYGYLAYARSRYYSRQCAESVTAWGRHFIIKTAEDAQKEGFNVLYQDSLPYERPIFVKNPNEGIELVKIGDFVRKHREDKEIAKYQTLAFDGSKTVFKPILRAIEHNYDSDKKGELLEFITTHGKTVVTPQHSVYRYNSEKRQIELSDAKNLKEGDFLISLTKPELPQIHHEGEIIDALNLDFGKYREELRAYPDNRCFPNEERGTCPYCKKEGVMLYSHVCHSHQDRKIGLEDAKKTKLEYIGGKYAKIGKIPRFWKLDKELAWMMGYYCAEGSASEKSEVHEKMMISVGSLDRHIIERVKKFFDGILGKNLAVIENYDGRINKKMYYYRVQCMPIVALFKHGFGMGNKSHGKRVPPIIYSSDDSLKKAFIDGYMEGDGSLGIRPRYKTYFASFSTKSPELAMGLQLLLKHFNHGETAFGKRISHIGWKYRTDKPGIVDLRMCGARSEKEEFDNFCIAKIKKINKLEEKRAVFDLEVEGLHNFVDAEGLILVHNTDSVFLLLEKRKYEDAIKWMEKLNSTLPGTMELELEAYYPRGVFVSKKMEAGGKVGTGAKKKYALMDREGKIKIRGFELVRRDWSVIARETQRKVLEAILKDGSKERAVDIVRKVVDEIKTGKMEIEKMAIETQLVKPLDKYLVNSPELSAALKANKRGKGEKLGQGSVVRYVITRSSTGGEAMEGNSKGTAQRGKNAKISVSDKAELLEYAKDYDADYYVNHQIIPTVLKILKELGVEEEDLKRAGKQEGLGAFF